MTWILLTSAWKRNHLNSTSQHHRNNELFYHPHVFSVQTFEQSKQVKLSCIAPVESGHCIAVKWCMPWKTLQNLMTWWTWSTEICASLMPPNHSHIMHWITNFTWKTLTILLTESQQHTFHMSWYKRFIASKAMRRKFFSISPHPFEQMLPKWTDTQALWKQDN